MILLFDSRCEWCRRLAAMVAAMDRRHRIRPLALDDPEAPRWFGSLPPSGWEGQVHLIQPDGRVASGPDVVSAVIRLLPGGSPLAWWLERGPGGRTLARGLYQVMGSFRGR